MRHALLFVSLLASVVSADPVDSPYGVCSHLFGGGAEKRAKTFAAARAAGIGWLRTDFWWSSIERRPGEWSFDAADAMVRDAEASGVRILPILDYDRPGAVPVYEHLPEWREYVRRTVGRYAKTLRHFEIWNEPNIFVGKSYKPDQYLAVLRAAAEEIRAIDPSIRVLISGFSQVPLDYIEAIYKLGGRDAFDIMCVHPYARPHGPEGRTDLWLEELRSLMARYGDAGKPIWITEIGWSTHEIRPSDDVVAACFRAAFPKAGRIRGAFVPVDNVSKPRNRAAAEAYAARLPFGSSVDALSFAELGRRLSTNGLDLVIFTGEAYPVEQADALVGFVNRGGVIAAFGGMPFWHGWRSDASGLAIEDRRADAHGFRRRLRVGTAAAWTNPALKRDVRVYASPGVSIRDYPNEGLLAARFVTAEMLADGDRFVPILEGKDMSGKSAYAAAFLRNGSGGGVVVATVGAVSASSYVDEAMQANMAVRAMAVSCAEGVERLFWYELRSPGGDRYDGECHFGLCHPDFSQRPSFDAVAHFTRERPAGSKQLPGSWHDEARRVYYPQWRRPDGTPAGVMWKTDGPQTVAFRFVGMPRFADVFGRPIAVLRNADGSYSPELSESPVFFSGAAVSPTEACNSVDPFVGTSATGHTFPGACVPFGLVQASPDCGTESWHYCSGYRYEDEGICGFSQTHLNGTGGEELGDVLLLPFIGAAPERGHRERIDKRTETASPGYYAVTLSDSSIRAEVTATEHAALYRFRYDGSGPARLLYDGQWGVVHEGRLTDYVKEFSFVREGDRGFSGHRQTFSWNDRTVAHHVVFDRPCSACIKLPKPKADEKGDRYVFDFDLKPGETLMVKVGLSACEGKGDGDADERHLSARARMNLEAEIPGWDFEGVRSSARESWNRVLSVATIEGTAEQKRNWYTSLYHLCIQPNNIADVGRKPFFSTLSCWDTFRAAGPLYTILYPDRAAAFVDSMLEQGRRTGHLPIWTLWGTDNQCMIGTHSVPMIVDWFLKNGGRGADRVDWEAAYRQIRDTLTKPHPGRIKENWDLYDKYGYYPYDLIRGESVSRTMECAYDDWCAGVMAEKLGHKEDAAFFFKRASNWKNVFDPSIGFARGKDSHDRWRTPYDPYAIGHGADTANDFTEGNAFQYSWHVMQDVPGLVAAMGGREAFVGKLDALFRAPEKTEGMGLLVDVTGLIGQYVHGNEPSHHVIYFYPQVGHPEKAAERIREVFDRFYLPKPDGLCGNDDCGQMSAWYLFSAMGFYPFNPCGGEYVIGAPQVEKVTLHCSPSPSTFTSFTILAKNLSKENKYVKSVTLNGKPLADWKLRHADILNGGELVFEMTGGK